MRTVCTFLHARQIVSPDVSAELRTVISAVHRVERNIAHGVEIQKNYGDADEIRSKTTRQQIRFA
jgi:hypothetical protein